jgi:glycosyltransferase 2 family protein
LKKKPWILGLIVAIALVALVALAHGRIHFNWRIFVEQIQLADWWRIALGVSLIWLAYGLRAARWSVLLGPTQKVSWLKLLGPQVIGFTGVALLGRPADLVRPYLVARKVRVTLSSQVAIYVVERMFDLGAMALIFSTVLFFAPDRATLPHPELLRRIAFTGLIGTIALMTLAAFVKLSGEAMAAGARRIFGGLSPKFGEGVASKLLAFREGLGVLSSVREVAVAYLLSLTMWGMISYAYLETVHAFVKSSQLDGLTLAGCMVLMAASMGGSAIQLPVIGWFTTIGIVAAAMEGFFHAAPEPALGCAAMLLIVTFLSIIPLGLLWARFDRVSLRKVTEESEHAGEELQEHPETLLQSEEAVLARE